MHVARPLWFTVEASTGGARGMRVLCPVCVEFVDVGSSCAYEPATCPTCLGDFVVTAFEGFEEERLVTLARRLADFEMRELRTP